MEKVCNDAFDKEINAKLGTGPNGTYVDADGKERMPTDAEMTALFAEMELMMGDMSKMMDSDVM